MTKRNTAKHIGLKELLLSLLFLLAAWLAKEVLDTDLTAGAPGPVTEPTGVLRVYFTSPETESNGMDVLLAEAIEGAQESIDIAAFIFDLPRVAVALIDAQGRDVRVRLVTDTDYEQELGPAQLVRAGIPVVTDDRDPYMHNKFVVIDGYQTWTGSWNLTESDTYANNNNVVVMNSTKIAQNYTTEFEEMFERREFGVTSPDTTPNPDVTLNGVRVETIFEAEGNVRERIIELINTAELSVKFMAFVFTDDGIAQALIARHRAGLEVSGVIEARNAGANGSDFASLRKAGVDVLEDGNRYILHHKVIIVDEAIVITGSYNFSASAADINDENSVIIHSPEIAQMYLEEFDRVYRQAQTAGN